VASVHGVKLAERNDDAMAAVQLLWLEDGHPPARGKGFEWLWVMGMAGTCIGERASSFQVPELGAPGSLPQGRLCKGFSLLNDLTTLAAILPVADLELLERKRQQWLRET
jgi:hypothetical protein